MMNQITPPEYDTEFENECSYCGEPCKNDFCNKECRTNYFND